MSDWLYWTLLSVGTAMYAVGSIGSAEQAYRDRESAKEAVAPEPDVTGEYRCHVSAGRTTTDRTHP